MEYFLLFLVMAFLLFGCMWFFWPQPKQKSRYQTILKPTIGEFALVSLAALLLSSAVVSFGMFSETSDTEILNGQVTNKQKNRVGCRHSYSCNCREVCSGSGQSRSCSTVCDTCYEHSYDIDWDVYSSIGGFSIDTIDRQGLREPPRWTIVKIGDPVSKSHTFLNYIKAARTNVLNRSGTKISYPMPSYPGNIYDYYKIDRTIGATNADKWNEQISLVLRELGPSKQVNLIMVFTKHPEEFADQLNASWIGGKKNDVIIVVGTQDGTKPDWVKVLSWSKREDFKVDLREAILESELKPEVTVPMIGSIINKSFERRHMKEFEYLKYDIEPPQWSFIAALIAFFVPLIGFIFYRRSL